MQGGFYHRIQIVVIFAFLTFVTLVALIYDSCSSTIDTRILSYHGRYLEDGANLPTGNFENILAKTSLLYQELNEDDTNLKCNFFHDLIQL